MWTYGKMPRSAYPNEAGWEYIYDYLGNAATTNMRWRKTNTITTTAETVNVPMFPLTEDADPRSYWVKPLPAVVKGVFGWYQFASTPLPEHRGWLGFIGDYQVGYSWFFNNGLSIIEVFGGVRR